MEKFTVFIGPLCVLAGMLIALYVKDRANEAAKAEVARSIVSSLATFESSLLEKLDKTYMRRGECDLKMEAHDDRLDVGNVRISGVENRLNTFATIDISSKRQKSS